MKENLGQFLLHLSQGVLIYLPTNNSITSDDLEILESENGSVSISQATLNSLFCAPTGHPEAILTIHPEATPNTQLNSLYFIGNNGFLPFSFAAVHAWFFNERYSNKSFNSDLSISLNTTCGIVNVSPLEEHLTRSVIKIPILKPSNPPDKNYQIGVPGLGLLNFQIGIGVDPWIIIPSESIAASTDPLHHAKLKNAGKWIIESVKNGITLNFFKSEKLNKIRGIAFYEITKHGLSLTCVTTEGNLLPTPPVEAVAACLTLPFGPFKHLATENNEGLELSATGINGLISSITIDKYDNLVSIADSKTIGTLLLV